MTYILQICTDKWITLQWYGVSVQVFVERIERNTTADPIDTLTAQMNQLTINTTATTVIATTIIDNNTIFTVNPPKETAELDQLSSTTQQIYLRLDSMLKAMTSHYRLSIQSLSTLLITGAIDQPSVYQHIR
jgi:hypothetical protein